MKITYLLLCITAILDFYNVDGHCIDIHSRVVSQGMHYVPGGTNPCTLCICDKGGPKWCKSVLCSPPQNCKSFQLGNSCCEFKCLDDILSGHDSYKETYDVALRFIASTVTAILFISLLFFLYNRLKRNKLMAHSHQREEQRNLSNVGYIAGNFNYTQHNIGYLTSGANDIEIRYEEPHSNFALWKPPGNYFPSGEAPPPYEEAMRCSQNEMTLNQNTTADVNTTLMPFSSVCPQAFNSAAVCRHEVNSVPPSTPQIPHISNNAPQYVNIRLRNYDVGKAPQRASDNQRRASDKGEVSYENLIGLKNNSSDRATSSGIPKQSAYSTKKSRNESNQIRSVPGSSTSIATYLHQQARVGAQTDNQKYLTGNPRSKLSDKANKNVRTTTNKAVHRTLPKSLRELLSNPENLDPHTAGPTCSDFSSKNGPTTTDSIPTRYLDSTHQQTKNLVTYQSISQDEEDYRSECENCKSNASSQNVVEDGEAINETMSLQRRNLTESGIDKCLRSSHTLPANTRKPRMYSCATNHEKWFSSVHQSSSEDSD